MSKYTLKYEHERGGETEVEFDATYLPEVISKFKCFLQLVGFTYLTWQRFREEVEELHRENGEEYYLPDNNKEGDK